MYKALSVTIGLLIAATAAGAAQAAGPAHSILEQERGRHSDTRLFGPSTSAQPTHGIVAQERGRRSDSRIFGPSTSIPVQVVGPPDSFDFADAGIGGAAGLALALLTAAAGLALRNGSRRREAGSAEPAG